MGVTEGFAVPLEYAAVVIETPAATSLNVVMVPEADTNPGDPVVVSVTVIVPKQAKFCVPEVN